MSTWEPLKYMITTAFWLQIRYELSHLFLTGSFTLLKNHHMGNRKLCIIQTYPNSPAHGSNLYLPIVPSLSIVENRMAHHQSGLRLLSLQLEYLYMNDPRKSISILMQIKQRYGELLPGRSHISDSIETVSDLNPFIDASVKLQRQN